MTKLKTMLGLCVLSALAICAFAAQSASAAPEGQTAYSCTKSAPTKTFSDAHCKTSGGSEYGHVVVPAGSNAITLTNITTGTERSTAKVKSVQSGVTLELQATEVEGKGFLENKSEGEKMWAQGTGTITFKNVTVTLPSGKGCKVPGGTVTTKELAGTTKNLKNQLKFEPGASAGGIFAEFTIEGCSVTELNHVYTATGSVIGNTEGTTTNFTHAATTTQGTFKLFGQKAGLEGSITLKNAAGDGIALT